MASQIISASYKTDIPTFYGEWLVNRLRAGYCKMVNPYGRQVYTVDLRLEAVEGIVFWTKNVGPLMSCLPEIRERGYKFVVQHSINGYPRDLESRVVDYERTVQCMHDLARDYGAGSAIWRYDPIVITGITPLEWHRQNFARLASKLEGAVTEVVVSFAQIYKKTKRNMDASARERGFDWSMHDEMAVPHDGVAPEAGLELIRSLAETAREHGIQLEVCSQEAYLIPGLVEEAHCVDATWFGGDYKRHGNRKECACSASRDIGEYDTCPHGCVYCYAVLNRALALRRYKEHNPDCAFLFPPKGHNCGKDDEPEWPEPKPQKLISVTARKRRVKQEAAGQQESLF